MLVAPVSSKHGNGSAVSSHGKQTASSAVPEYNYQHSGRSARIPASPASPPHLFLQVPKSPAFVLSVTP